MEEIYKQKYQKYHQRYKDLLKQQSGAKKNRTSSNSKNSKTKKEKEIKRERERERDLNETISTFMAGVPPLA